MLDEEDPRTVLSRIDTADVLQVRTADPPPERPRIALRPPDGQDGSAPPPVEAELRADGVLEADLSGVSIPDGEWEVLLSSAGGLRPVLTADPGLDLAERAAYLVPPRRRELRTRRAPDGRLLLRARTVTPYAEVERVELHGSVLTVAAVLAYTRRVPGRSSAVLLARQRGSEAQVTVPVSVVEGAAQCPMPLLPVAEAHDEEGEAGWDLWLCTRDEPGGLRLAARRDDIADKKKRFVFPEVELPGGRLRMRPYYTISNAFSLRVRHPAQARRKK